MWLLVGGAAPTGAPLWSGFGWHKAASLLTWAMSEDSRKRELQEGQVLLPQFYVELPGHDT